MPFIVEEPAGTEEFPDETLLIFVDETGHKEFADPRAPFFGFGGCLCPVPTYSSWIEGPWEEVQAQFPSDMLPFHAADLRPAELSAEQLTSISTFFANRSFQCFAAVASNQVLDETHEALYHIMARATYERIVDLTRRIHGLEFMQIVMLFEHSERTDRVMGDYFERYDFRKRDGARVPVHYCTMTKQDELPAGLIVADFVAHTAGAQTRARIRGDKGFRRDFDDIFGRADVNLRSFIEVTRVAPKRLEY